MKSVVKTIRGEGGGWVGNRERPPLTLHTPGSKSFVAEGITLFERREKHPFSQARKRSCCPAE